MSNKFKSAHGCKTPTLMMRTPGHQWRCPECGAGWTVSVMKRRTILGKEVETRYWKMTRSPR